MLNQREISRAGKWTTPEKLLSQSGPITGEERQRFLALHQGEQAKANQEAPQQLANPKLTEKRRLKINAKIKRMGTSQALVKSGNLSIEEGRITPPVSAELCPTICGG